MDTMYPGTGQAASTIQPYSAGWNCYQCGAFVPNGVTHYCSTARSFPPPTPTKLTDADIERIARRVIELLRESKDI